MLNEVHGVWRRAFVIEVVGLNLNAMSCASAGNCLAGGDQQITDGGASDGTLVEEINGHWGEVGVAGLFDNCGCETFTAVSCSSAGDCAAGGFGDSPFLAIERDGRWGTEFRVAGNVNGQVLTSVSCAAEGNCAVGGYYQDATGKFQGFVLNEAGGHRGNAIEIPINRNGQAQLTVAVSCGAASTCAAGGSYTDRSGRVQGFVMNEVRGHWGQFIAVPGLPALNTGGRAFVTSVSCASAGNCVAAGGFTKRISASATLTRPFVVSERNGRWGKAIAIRGVSGNAAVNSVSCALSGNCAAGGPRFLVDETNGRWHRAILVPAG